MTAKKKSPCDETIEKLTPLEINEMTLLSPNFEPGPFDVICGRGNISRNHTGNKKFRKMIARFLPPYAAAVTKSEKSSVVSHIVDAIRDKTKNDGGFVKKKEEKWYEVGDRLAREKVGQGFRESLHTKYKSSNESKKRRRKQDLDRIDRLAEDFVLNHCTDLIKTFQDISMSPDSKTETGTETIQSLFNKTQSELFERIKKIGKYNVDPIIVFSSNKKMDMEKSLLGRKRSAVAEEPVSSSSASSNASEKERKDLDIVLSTNTARQLKRKETLFKNEAISIKKYKNAKEQHHKIAMTEKKEYHIPDSTFSIDKALNRFQMREGSNFDIKNNNLMEYRKNIQKVG